MYFASSLTPEIRARSLVAFLAAQHHTLGLADAVSLVVALEEQEEKKVARQLAALLKQRHGIELKHTNALKVVGLMSGRAGWHKPTLLTPYRLVGSNPAGGVPAIVSSHTSLKGALADLITAFGRETAAYEGPRFTTVSLRGGKLTFECEFAGAAHTRWVIDMDPVESGGRSYLDSREVRWCVERLRREIEEKWRGGLLTGAVQAEFSRDDEFNDTLMVHRPGFNVRDLQPGWGELATLRELEVQFGTDALRAAMSPEDGVLAIGDARLNVEMFGVRNNDNEVMGFVSRALPVDGIAKLVRRYRRLCDAWGTTLSELAEGHWEDAPVREPKFKLNVKRFWERLKEKNYDFRELQDTSGVDRDELDAALDGAPLRASRILTLASYLDFSANELLQVTPELRPLYSPSHLAGEIANSSERDVRVWGGLTGDVADARIAEASAILRRFPLKSASAVAEELVAWSRSVKVSLWASREECFTLETAGEAPITGSVEGDAAYEYPGMRMTLLLQGTPE